MPPPYPQNQSMISVIYRAGTTRVRRPQQPIAHVAPDGSIIYAASVEEPGPPPSYESLHCPLTTYDQWVGPRTGRDEQANDTSYENNKSILPGGEENTNVRATAMTTTPPPPYWMRPYTVTTTVTEEESDDTSGGLF